MLETLPPAATRVAFPPNERQSTHNVNIVIHALSRVDNHGTRPPPEEQRQCFVMERPTH